MGTQPHRVALHGWYGALECFAAADGQCLWACLGGEEPLTAGATVTENDVVQAEVNWAEDASPIPHDRTLWLGRWLPVPCWQGQALRHNMLRPAQVFQVGATVRVVGGAGCRGSR